ncbi:hypothetical protein J4Q44_G00331100, partial [Coregonus suidteri]
PNVCGNRCCHGWTVSPKTQKCTKPRRLPRCHNGAVCRQPNICECRTGFYGARLPAETTALWRTEGTPASTTNPETNKYYTVRWQPLTLQAAQSVLLKKALARGGRSDKMTTILMKHIETERKKLQSASSSDLQDTQTTSVKSFHTQKGQYTVHVNPPAASNQTTGHRGGMAAGAGRRGGVLFTPTICKQKASGLFDRGHDGGMNPPALVCVVQRSDNLGSQGFGNGGLCREVINDSSHWPSPWLRLQGHYSSSPGSSLCTNSRCENTPGSYRCVCHTGYKLQGKTCTDVDECKLLHPEVCKSGVCINNIPGYSCSCTIGYYYDNVFLECIDVDECEAGEDSCPGGICVNTLGSYFCTCDPPLVLDDTQRSCVNSTGLTTLVLSLPLGRGPKSLPLSLAPLPDSDPYSEEEEEEEEEKEEELEPRRVGPPFPLFPYRLGPGGGGGGGGGPLRVYER